MNNHFILIEKFNALLEEQEKKTMMKMQQSSSSSAAVSSSLPFAAELNETSRGIIFNAVLHACDISNPSKQWALQRKWSDAVVEEFLHQGDMEKTKGLNVSPNCDRNNTDQSLLTMNFIDFVVAPLVRFFTTHPHTRTNIVPHTILIEFASIFLLLLIRNSLFSVSDLCCSSLVRKHQKYAAELTQML